jgi:hypothetical protein
MVLLTGLGTGLTAIANTERLAADNFRAGIETTYAADVAAALVVRELEARAEWTTAICCDNRSTLVDATRTPTLPSGDVVDLDRLTANLQRQTDTETGAGAAREQWRPFAWGPLERVAGGTSGRALPYAMVWVADDRGETDGDPATDSNGTVVVRVRTSGARGSMRDIEQVLRRGPDARVEVLSWREVR